MSQIDKLKAFIKSKGMDFDSATYDRTYAGHWQRAGGAWIGVLEGHGKSLGWYQPLRNLLKCPTLSIGAETTGGDYFVECDCKSGEGCHKR